MLDGPKIQISQGRMSPVSFFTDILIRRMTLMPDNNRSREGGESTEVRAHLWWNIGSDPD
jgi:hypothetical protein